MRQGSGRGIILASLVLGAALAGCGQKGPLYLPGESAETVEPGLPAEGGTDAGAREEDDEETTERP